MTERKAPGSLPHTPGEGGETAAWDTIGMRERVTGGLGEKGEEEESDL